MAYDPWLDGGVAAEQNYSDETGLFQKIGYGAIGALTSGVQGFYNTGVALGNAFGANWEQADTSTWLANNVSQEASRFYQDNQTILDAAGMLVTSLAPGAIAIKIAGAARMGKMLNTMKWATGLENGVAGKYVAQAAEIAKNGSMTANIWAPKVGAFAGAIADSAIDGAVAGTAILATQNQNASINKDGLSYFQSFKTNFNDFVNPFTSPVSMVMFGGIAGVAGLSALGKVNRAINSADAVRNPRLIYSSTEGTSANIGDSYLHLIQQRDAKVAAATGFAPEEVGYRDLTSTANTIDTQAKGVLMEAIKGKDPALGKMVTDVMIGSKDLDSQSNLFGGLQQIQRVTRSLGPGQDDFGSPLLKVFNSEEYQAYKNERQIPVDFNGLFAPKGLAPTSLTDATDAPTILLRNIEYFKSKGLNEDEAMLGTFLHETGHFRTIELSNGIDLATGRQFTLTGNMSPENIDSFKPGKGATAAERNMFNKMKQISDELVTLSRQARPASWAVFDSLDKAVKAGTASELELYQHGSSKKYLYDINELMADSWRILSSDGIAAKQYISSTPKVYNLFKRNGSLFEQYGVNKVGFDSWTGAVTDNVNAATSTMKITPQIGDIGGIQLANKGDAITWGQGKGVKTVDLTGEWDPLKLSPEDSDAMFAGQQLRWRDQKFAVQNWDTATDLSNLPELQARLAKLREWEASGVTDNYDNLSYVNVTDKSVGGTPMQMGADELERHIIDQKQGLFQKLAQQNVEAPLQEKINPQEFERALNIDSKAAILNDNGDWMTYASHDPTEPRHAILSYDKRMDITDVQARSMVGVMNRIDQIQQQCKRISSNVLENRWAEGNTLLSMADNPADTATVTRAAKTRGFFNSANGGYGTFMSYAQAVGKYVDKLSVKINDFMNTEASNAFYDVVNNRDALAELNTIWATKLRGKQGWSVFSTSANDTEVELLKQAGFKLDNSNGKFIVDADMLQDLDKVVSRSKGNPDRLDELLQGFAQRYQEADNVIPLVNEATHSALEWMQKANADMVGDKARLRAAAGRTINWKADRIYVPPPSADQFTHVAFVRKQVPEGLQSAQEHCLIFGQDAQELANKINLIKQNIDGAEVLTKDEMIAYKKANGEYNPSEMLSERSFNTELRRLGVLDSPLPRMDTLELQGFTEYLKRQHVANARDAVSLMHANEIAELSHQANLFENVSASQTQGLSRIFRSRDSANPYQSAIDTLLNRNNGSQWALWKTVAENIDSGFSKVVGNVSGMFQRAVTDADFMAINKYLEKEGLQPAYKTAAELQDVNRQVDRRMLTTVVGKANAICATGQLSLDFLESIVNAVSLPIMLVPELFNLKTSLTTGAAKDLLNVQIPGTDTLLPSNTKVIANAIKDWVGGLFGSNTKIEDYKRLGLLGREVDFVQQATQATMLPAELFSKADGNAANAALIEFNNKVNKGVEFLKNVTQAQRSEQAVRFISANIAEQIAKAAGITDLGQRTALMNTFVNRVHGNYTAAQKPFLFQGVVGQAISLFQTYQFNLMQQAFRNVADGNKKAMAMMMGLQGTIYGMRGLPAFNAVNQRIAELHGNRGDDAISSTYDAAGPKMADWLVYGGASNLLGVDIFNRGDINPRHPTIVPTSFADIPAVSMATKFFQNVAHTASALSASGLNGNTLLEGVAHNGLNRPLAGIAASMLGYRTTTQGGLLMAQKDESAWASTAAAFVGGKLLDEAIALDTLYRKVGYDAARTKAIQAVGSKYLGALRSGADIDQEQMMQDFVKHGGQQEKFNQWYRQLSLNANQGQLQKLVSSNNSDNVKFYQGILGTDRSLNTIREPTMYSASSDPAQSVSPDVMAQMPQQ